MIWRSSVLNSKLCNRTRCAAPAGLRIVPMWCLYCHFRYTQGGREGATLKWVTRERIRMDRATSARLILRFVDKEAGFEFVPTKGALELAQEKLAIPFVIPGVELSRKEGNVTFDAILEKYGL